MAESKCLNCEKPIESYTGRRPKKFCSDTCRATYNAKNRAKNPKWVQRETYEKAIAELEALKQMVQKRVGDENISALKSVIESETEESPKTEPSGIVDTNTHNSVIDGLIAAKKAEIAKLGVGGFATQLRKKYEKDIVDLLNQKK